MKSEHRHELKTNSLAEALANLPQTLKTHGNKILTVLAIVLLIIAGVRYKRSQDEAARIQVRQSLATAWTILGNIQGVREPSVLDQAEIDVKSAAQNVIDTADASDHAILASAYQALGQLYWTLATQSPLASTQPATQPATRPTNYLELSEQAYTRILSDFADQPQAVIAAHLALAAIAEEKHLWDMAQQHYQKVIESADALPTDKRLAQNRLASLKDLQNPLLLIPASQPVRPDTTPATQAVERETTFSPTTLPTTVPTTQPVQ